MAKLLPHERTYRHTYIGVGVMHHLVFVATVHHGPVLCTTQFGLKALYTLLYNSEKWCTMHLLVYKCPY